jgi:hypothetical protein
MGTHWEQQKSKNSNTPTLYPIKKQAGCIWCTLQALNGWAEFLFLTVVITYFGLG